MNWGVWIGYFLALVVVVPAMLWGVFSLGEPPVMNAVLVVAAGLVGWIVGMLMAPVSPGETKLFPEYGKAISTFAGGYLVGKLDRLIDLYLKDDAAITGLLVGRFALVVIGFALGALASYVWRTYVSPGQAQARATSGEAQKGWQGRGRG